MGPVIGLEVPHVMHMKRIRVLVQVIAKTTSI